MFGAHLSILLRQFTSEFKRKWLESNVKMRLQLLLVEMYLTDPPPGNDDWNNIT